jgi:uncharacterized protein
VASRAAVRDLAALSVPGRILLLLAALLSSSGCAWSPGANQATLLIHTSTGLLTIHARVAETSEAHQRGLAGRRALAPDSGMAFVFGEPVRARFWMKDTLIPLSIAFWGRDGRIVSIMDMPLCRADPCPSYRASTPYVGALEVNLGFFRRHRVRVGDRIELEHS